MIALVQSHIKTSKKMAQRYPFCFTKAAFPIPFFDTYFYMLISESARGYLIYDYLCEEIHKAQ